MALHLLHMLLLTAVYTAIAQPTDVTKFIFYKDLLGKPYNVTYDERSFMINEQRTLLLGGSVHYPRFSPSQWPDIMDKALDDGLNHLEVYVFWNLHEPKYQFDGNHIFNYEERANITKFLQIAQDKGLFINLRIGPYACAEWSFGGVPTWILHDPEVVIRSSNKKWKEYMKTFVDEISNVARPYLAKNGGPIILAQIENEYHGPDDDYVAWCGELAESEHFDIPWVMCNGKSANNTINVCNGNNCYDYAKSHGEKYPGQPLGWTENEGWFQFWGKSYDANITERDNRSPADMAQSVAIWMAAGGAHHNYYMWMGGNHVANTAGSGVTNMYADGVNYHADGLPHEPKRTHLKRLHLILAEYQGALLSNPIQIGHEVPLTPDGDSTANPNTFAYEYPVSYNKSLSLTFLVNQDSTDHTLSYQDRKYKVPGNSVSIINGDGDELYNTATVDAEGLPTERVNTVLFSGHDLKWQFWTDSISSDRGPDIQSETPLEQIRLTNDSSEYLYYRTTFKISKDIPSESVLAFAGRAANAYTVYIDGVKFTGSDWNGLHAASPMMYRLEINQPVPEGQCTLTVLSSSLGIDNYNGVAAGASPDQCDKKGLTGSVRIEDKNKNKLVDITNSGWHHWIGLTGETLNIFGDGMDRVKWNEYPMSGMKIPATTWFKTEFKSPSDKELEAGVILIDIGENGVSRGHFYINGHDMGHYNNHQMKDEMIQRFYFVPTDCLQPNGGMNSLLFFQEYVDSDDADVRNIAIVSSTVTVSK